MALPRAVPSASVLEGINVKLVIKHTFLECAAFDDDAEEDLQSLQSGRHRCRRGRSLSDSELECTPVPSSRGHTILDLLARPLWQRSKTPADDASVDTAASFGMADDASIDTTPSLRRSSQQSETSEHLDERSLLSVSLRAVHDIADGEPKSGTGSTAPAIDCLLSEVLEVPSFHAPAAVTAVAPWSRTTDTSEPASSKSPSKPARTPLSAKAAPFQSGAAGPAAFVYVPRDRLPMMMPQDQYSPPALHDPSQQNCASQSPASLVHAPAPSELRRDKEFTTLMFRNLPNRLMRDSFVELMDNEGFEGTYDFVYLPFDFHRNGGFGYAFVNFVASENAKRAMEHFQGFARWGQSTPKVCEVSWSDSMQGLKAHVARFRDSPVMHESVPECFKPIILKESVRQPFPSPTKPLRRPRVKRGTISGI